MTQGGGRPGHRRWLGFLLGTGSAFATQASGGVPERWPSWLFLCAGSVAAGLLTQTALDRATREIEAEAVADPGGSGRSWRLREAAVWALVLLLVAGCGLSVAWAA